MLEWGSVKIFLLMPFCLVDGGHGGGEAMPNAIKWKIARGYKRHRHMPWKGVVWMRRWSRGQGHRKERT